MNFLRTRLTKFLDENPSGSSLIVINSHDQIEALAEAIKGLSHKLSKGSSILCFKSSIPDAFSELAVNVEISEDYLAREDYLRIDDYVYNGIAKEWDKEAKVEFKDIFTYRGIELDRIAEYDFQNFLITKIKALTVIDRAIRKGSYTSVFIIDFNDELANFDRFLTAQYKVNSCRITRPKRLSFLQILKREISFLACSLMDRYALSLIKGRKDVKLIDSRLFCQLDAAQSEGFLPFVIGKGLRPRIAHLLKARAYAAFELDFVHMIPYLCQGYSTSFSPEYFMEKFVFEGMNYWELIREKISSLVYGDFCRFRRNVDNLHKLKDICGIRSIALRNYVRELEKTLVLTARGISVPTLVVQHGILAEFNGHSTIFANKIAVWGDYAVKWYRQFENDPTKITVTGNPVFDETFHYLSAQRDYEDKREKLGLVKRKYLATLFTPGIDMLRLSSFATDDITETLIKNVLKAVKSMGDINLIVKLHPNEDEVMFKKLITPENRGFATVIGNIDNLDELVAASDVVITLDSTVGLMAVAANKPILAINFGKRHQLVPYAEGNVAIDVRRQDQMTGAIEKALHDEDTKKIMSNARQGFLNNFLYKQDGQSTTRVLQLIEELK